jgi:hypothetical protein
VVELKPSCQAIEGGRYAGTAKSVSRRLRNVGPQPGAEVRSRPDWII